MLARFIDRTRRCDGVSRSYDCDVSKGGRFVFAFPRCSCSCCYSRSADVVFVCFSSSGGGRRAAKIFINEKDRIRAFKQGIINEAPDLTERG